MVPKRFTLLSRLVSFGLIVTALIIIAIEFTLLLSLYCVLVVSKSNSNHFIIVSIAQLGVLLASLVFATQAV